MHTNERSINVILKLFDLMNELPLCFCARNFVPKVAWSTPVMGEMGEIGAPTPGLCFA